jgi:hypothetical protein
MEDTPETFQTRTQRNYEIHCRIPIYELPRTHKRLLINYVRNVTETFIAP